MAKKNRNRKRTTPTHCWLRPALTPTMQAFVRACLVEVNGEQAVVRAAHSRRTARTADLGADV